MAIRSSNYAENQTDWVKSSKDYLANAAEVISNLFKKNDQIFEILRQEMGKLFDLGIQSVDLALLLEVSCSRNYIS